MIRAIHTPPGLTRPVLVRPARPTRLYSPPSLGPFARSARQFSVSRLASATANSGSSTATGAVRAGKGAAKAARMIASLKRASSFAFFSALAIAGLGFTGTAVYYFAQELIVPSSDVQIFQRAFKMIEHDAKVHELLGGHLKGHGEETTNNRWSRNRPIASRRSVDRFGREHVVMQFHVDGEKNKGLARLELVDNNGKRDFRYLVLEVPGHPRHYLINEEPKPVKKGFFGIQWGPKKD